MIASRWPRRLLVAGLLAMVFGALDPLEGSIVILLGSVLATSGAWLGRSRHRLLVYWSLILLAIGIGVMWGISALGGFGGSTGRTLWWWLALVPYPVGWVMGLIGIVKSLGRPPTSGLRHAVP